MGFLAKAGFQLTSMQQLTRERGNGLSSRMRGLLHSNLHFVTASRFAQRQAFGVAVSSFD
jgi:hypothetical protein